MSDEGEVGRVMLELVAERGPGRTICPSEVARRLGGDWRARMDEVRQVAARLAADGRIVGTQKGRVVETGQARGPIRLGLPGEAG